MNVNGYECPGGWTGSSQQEVDLVEVRSGNPSAFEFKYSSDKKIKIPVAFASAYPNATFERISKDNYLDWIE
jgi:hypothetical protein